MAKKKEDVTVKIVYNMKKDEPGNGIFRSYVEMPKGLKDCYLWVDEKEEYNFETDKFKKIAGEYTVNICATKKSLFELGKFLIAMSKFKTEDIGHHAHLTELGVPSDKGTCDLIIHHPNKLK